MRVSALQHAAVSPERADALSQASAPLVDPAGMGREYKVMGMMGGAAGATDTDGVWPFVASETQEEGAEATQARLLSPDARGAGVAGIGFARSGSATSHFVVE
jgi:hypothetical protein